MFIWQDGRRSANGCWAAAAAAGHNWRGRVKQLVPAHHRRGEVQLVEDNLHDAHENLLLHSTVVAPDYHLQTKEKTLKFSYENRKDFFR